MNFETLIAEEQPRITRRLARSLGGDFGAAEDLCQEILVRAWRKLPRGADVAAQRAWLWRAASNITIDELRRRGRYGTVALENAAELATGDLHEPDTAREALGRLTAHERLLVLLRFDAGLHHAEIAELLSITEEAARKRTARARRAFVDAYRATRSEGPPLILLNSPDKDPQPYVRWLEQAGARVKLQDDQPTERELALADGFVFGGAFDDIHSGLYGESPRTLRGEIDLERDYVDLAVVASVLALDLPYVGICRGHQLMNIACGGSLYQDVVVDGAARRSHDSQQHPVETAPEASTRTMFGRTVDVHSAHHQAVNRLGRKLRVAALSPDGVIESIEHTGKRFALGVQWHPESANGNGDNRIAEALLDAAIRRAA